MSERMVVLRWPGDLPRGSSWDRTACCMSVNVLSRDKTTENVTILSDRSDLKNWKQSLGSTNRILVWTQVKHASGSVR